jgi:hypothetical protein
MIWLLPLKDKSSPEVARALTTWTAWCGQPYRFYCNNRSEFKGNVDDLLVCQNPPVETIRGRAYYPQTQGSIKKANNIFKL